MFTCLRNFCQWSSCPAHPEATCRVNPCGGCKVEFVDKDGKVVDCKEGNIILKVIESTDNLVISSVATELVPDL